MVAMVMWMRMKDLYGVLVLLLLMLMMVVVLVVALIAVMTTALNQISCLQVELNLLRQTIKK